MGTYIERIVESIVSRAKDEWRCVRYLVRRILEKKYIMGSNFQIIQLGIEPEALKKFPNRQRNQLVGCMHAHNELAVLNRLLMFSLNDVGDGELHDDAHGVQMWTIMQLLSGKLFETWNMLAERLLAAKPEDPAITGLSDQHKISLAWLKDYFGEPSLKETALRTIRDKTAFHYDRLNLDQAVASLTEQESKVYLAEYPANSCYYVGAALVFRAAFTLVADKAIDTATMSDGERMEAGAKIALDALNEANLHIHNVLYGLIDGLLQVAIGMPLEHVEQLRIPVVDSPAPTVIGLPMFVDIGNGER